MAQRLVVRGGWRAMVIAAAAGLIPGLVWAQPQGAPRPEPPAEVQPTPPLPAPPPDLTAEIAKLGPQLAQYVRTCTLPASADEDRCGKGRRPWGTLARRSPALAAHLYGQFAVPALVTVLAPVPMGKWLGELPFLNELALADKPLVAQYVGAWLGRALAGGQATPGQLDRLAQLAERAVGLPLFAAVPWQTDQSLERAEAWRQWLALHAAAGPKEWRRLAHLEAAQMAAQATWEARYRAVKLWDDLLQRPEPFGQQTLAWARQLVLSTAAPAAVREAMGRELLPMTLVDVLYPASRPREDWSWAIVPVAAVARPVLYLPGDPTPTYAPHALPAQTERKLAKLQARVRKVLAGCTEAFAGREEPDTGPAWCHAASREIPDLVDPVLAAHLIGRELRERGLAIEAGHEDIDSPRSESLLLQLQAEMDRSTGLRYVALAWQDLVAGAPSLSARQIGNRAHELEISGFMLTGVPLCVRLPDDTAQPLRCAGPWLKWLRVAETLTCDQWTTLRDQVWQADATSSDLEKLMPLAQLPYVVGKSCQDDEVPEPATLELAIRNAFLDKRWNLEQLTVFDEERPLASLHARLYPPGVPDLPDLWARK